MKVKKIYFENLDSLRGIAALGVMFFHISFWFKYPENEFYKNLSKLLSFGGDGGKISVLFFFILSGFLITYLLFLELENNNNIKIKNFYIRRLLRIWPLYFLTIIIGFFIYPLVQKVFYNIEIHENASFSYYALFIANFDQVYNGNPTSNLLCFQWSVAIEEQFYFLWPLIFMIKNIKKYFLGLSTIFIIVSEYYFNQSQTWEMGYYHSLCCVRFLAYGGILAFFCYYYIDKIKGALLYLGKIFNFCFYICCLACIYFKEFLSNTFENYKYFYHLLPFIFFGYIIIEQCFSANSVLKLGQIKWLNKLGKYSYGIYLLHALAINITMGIFNNQPNFVILEISFASLLTIGLSAISYIYFESYFLKKKTNFI